MARPFPDLSASSFAAVAGGLAAAASLVGLLAPFDLPVGDLLLRLRPHVAAEGSLVAAVVLDDRALDALGPLPWPRERLAEVVDGVFDAGAWALALDLIIADPDREDGDRALEAALDRGPVVLAAALREDGGWLLPLARFGGADRAAHAEAEVGPDGVVRSVLATKQRGGLSLPALSLAAARLVRPAIPITPGAELRPDFALPPHRVPRVGALELLDRATAPADLLAGKVVFVGTTATAASDQFVTPVGGLSPGVLVHAAAAASILDTRLVRPLPAWAVVLGCLALALLAQIARDRAGRVRLVHFAVVGALLVAAGVAATALGGVRPPLVTFAVAFGASALLREAAESRRAQAETGRLLRRLVAEETPAPAAVASPAEAPAPPGPRGAAARLELARELQERVIRDRNLRRALLDSLEDGVVRSDPAGRVVLANAAAAELWGGDPEADPELAEAIAAAASARGEAPDGGVPMERGGRDLRLTVRALEDGGTLAVLRDVTAEHQLESRRREMQRMVSHELKTPLSSIASFGGMLERYQLSEEELARLAGLIRGESERLLDMVTTFLDLERLGSGRWEGERGPVDLAALVRERVEVLGAAAAARGQELAVTAEPGREGGCRVSGDARLLARVVDNLAGNAIKYSSPGGRIDLSLRRDGDRVALAVADGGPGIPAEALPHLFERFFRVRATAFAEGPGPPAGTAGSGLGLALVREIAEWHGGCVGVESEPGRGSVFTVHLPALDPAGEGDTG